MTHILPDLARARASVEFNQLHNASEKAAKTAICEAV